LKRIATRRFRPTARLCDLTVTRGKGGSGSAVGARDLYGNTRVFGRRSDIGCAELQYGNALVIFLR
jgi:hypothetical protein